MFRKLVEKLRKKQSLEAEFETYKALHKYSILFAVIKKYYIDLQGTGVNIPDFLRDDAPELLAKRDLKNLLARPDGGFEFNRLYELAWRELAHLLD